MRNEKRKWSTDPLSAVTAGLSNSSTLPDMPAPTLVVVNKCKINNNNNNKINKNNKTTTINKISMNINSWFLLIVFLLFSLPIVPPLPPPPPHPHFGVCYVRLTLSRFSVFCRSPCTEQRYQDSVHFLLYFSFAESTYEWVNKRSKYVTQVQQQRPESPTVTLTWHTCKHKVHKLHQRYILCMLSLHERSGPRSVLDFWKLKGAEWLFPSGCFTSTETSAY